MIGDCFISQAAVKTQAFKIPTKNRSLTFFTKVQNSVIEFLTLRQHEKTTPAALIKHVSVLQYVACLEHSALHLDIRIKKSHSVCYILKTSSD